MRERRRWVSALLWLAVVAVVAGSWLLASVVGGASDEKSAFTGTDSVATTLLTESGVQPWFSPVFEPGEVESGLFALQAALGAAIFGYAVGRLHARRLQRTGAAESRADDASCT